MPTPTTPTPPFNLACLATVLGDSRRWRILNLLSSGEAMMVKEIAEALGEKSPNVSNHMKVLLWAGLVTVGSGRMYRMAEPYRRDLAQRQINLGFCILQLDAVAEHGAS